jgi:hypothetical protein
MNRSGIQTSLLAFMFTVSIPERPAFCWDHGQDNASQNPPQDQNKQQKTDQNGAKDSLPPSKAAKSSDSKNSGDKPAPLFGGSLNVKSSRQTKDTATLGFNGVDDNGQVQKSFLSATASGADTSAVQEMTSLAVNQAELDEFVQQGGLNANPPPKKSSNPGDKP